MEELLKHAVAEVAFNEDFIYFRVSGEVGEELEVIWCIAAEEASPVLDKEVTVKEF